MTWNNYQTFTPVDLNALRGWVEDTVMVGTTSFSKQDGDGAGGNSTETWWQVEIDCFNRATPLTQKFVLSWQSGLVTYCFDTRGQKDAITTAYSTLDHYDSLTLTTGVQYIWWVSDVNPSAFLITRGTDTVFYWPGYRSGHNKIHAYGVDGDNDRQTEVGMWISHNNYGNHWMMKGRPLDLAKLDDGSINDPVGPMATPFFDDPGSSAYGTPVANKSVLYSNSWYGAGTNSEAVTNADPDGSTAYVGYQGNVVNINQPDVYHWIPAGITAYYAGGYATNGGKVVFDGTNYYWATYSSEFYSGLWFDMGLTDQTL